MPSMQPSAYITEPTPSSLPSFSSFSSPFSFSLFSSGSTTTSFWSTTIVLIVSLLVAEQTWWRYRKGALPGHKWQIPLIGQFAESLHPSMEAYMRSWAKPLASVSVFNIFIVIASTTDYSRKILNASSYTEPCLVRSAKQILLPENWVFLNGKVHNEYRKGLNVLFTSQALAIYLKVQDRIYRSFFKEWLVDPDPKPKPYTFLFRDLNMETSLRVFCGDYIAQENVREITDKYWLITKALELVNFPFSFPGTKVYNACRARASTLKYLAAAARQSKEAMMAGKEADCLLDAWVEQILATREYQDNKEGGAERPNLLVKEYSDHEMSLVLLSFIFASQDAMSSSLTFGFQHLADYPAVFAKVREEQERIRAGDHESAVTLEQLEQMPYTNAVVREVLRHRPPVLMVPYLTKKAFPITEDYTVPKGTMLIPSFWNSLHDPSIYPDPDEFIPERWMPGGANFETTDSKTWLVFGAGAHRCIAQNYVFMHMTACLGTAALLMDWEHEKTAESDEIQIIATIFPKDGTRLKFRPRTPTSA
ncbi:C-22 sterol desaturase [Microbotryum lychnidis-dioicae p1A1 Lamole]|uniref:sterol 22-desaturase n=1 Tax=Microbotryum lychnidis-dioicae (strain p1A1 Lamole / MvSl-1064) TaxID=683840 RepID=U5H1E4_USTV1|nr:C-22 sterol desaturase [Microbotryum lychnidis-dioicae p1A1 Lamole]|eukprot:KDE08747.1 C-22 sterol desaturase [Microbotryum lychnidis-dioicae p1A1 Lamole]